MRKTMILIWSVCVALTLSGCHHHHSEEEEHEHGHSHEHEAGHEHHEHNATLQLTAYGSHYELYAEVTPLIKGEDCDLLCHFTRLSDFKPLEAGTLSVTLSAGGKSQSVSVSELAKPGIFSLEMEPQTLGKATLTFVVSAQGVKDTLVVRGLEVYDDEHEAHHEAEEQKISSPTAVTFTKEQSWQVDFATAMPQVIPFGQSVQTVAQVQSAQGDMMTVVARTNGIVRFAGSNLVEGREIAQGTAICTVVSDGLVDDNLSVRLQEAKNEYELAKQNFDRAKPLVEKKIVSQQEFSELQRDFENAKLRYENLQKNGSGGSVSVSAPMGGYITDILVQNGGYVTVGQPIMNIAKNRDIVLKAEVSQRYASVLPAISDANIENPGTGEVLSLSEMHGRVLSYGRAASAGSHMLPVTIQIQNAHGFTPGSFVKMWLSSQSSANALVIPKSSLVEEQGNYYVFVQLTPELFEKRGVKIGATDGRMVEVLSGITSTQRIVTRGAVLVKLAKSSGALDPHAGHVH